MLTLLMMDCFQYRKRIYPHREILAQITFLDLTTIWGRFMFLFILLSSGNYFETSK